MTAEPDLLPLPEVKLDGFTTHDMADYARANVAHALVIKQAEHEQEIAAKDAEIADLMECNRSLMDALNVAELSNEALRAEVDEWKRRGEAYFQTAEQQGKSAERLAEALREARQMIRDLLPDATFTKWDALLREQEAGR